MIVPQYWSEASARHRDARRQLTMRRFAWSDQSQAAAQAHAEARVAEAMQRVLAGEMLPKREPKVGYNGATGVPIREEIVDRSGETHVPTPALLSGPRERQALAHRHPAAHASAARGVARGA